MALRLRPLPLDHYGFSYPFSGPARTSPISSRMVGDYLSPGQYADSSEPAYLTERVGTAELSGRGIGYSELDVFALHEAVIGVRERSSSSSSSRGQHRGGIRASNDYGPLGSRS